MAAFTAKNPDDGEAFAAHWTKILGNKTNKNNTVLFNGHIAGHIAYFEQAGEIEVTYWIGKEYWGQGIATKALSKFLPIIEARPLFARAAKDNIASLRVLEKCGFKFLRSEKDFANGRGEEIEEIVLKLEAFGTEECLTQRQAATLP